MADESLIVEVVRSGGVAGITRHMGPVDAGSLSPEDAGPLVELARTTAALASEREAGTATTPSRSGPGRPDAFQYDIILTDEHGQRSFRVVESSSSQELQEAARELVRVLQRLTRRPT
jgi:hypothetical protein